MLKTGKDRLFFSIGKSFNKDKVQREAYNYLDEIWNNFRNFEAIIFLFSCNYHKSLLRSGEIYDFDKASKTRKEAMQFVWDVLSQSIFWHRFIWLIKKNHFYFIHKAYSLIQKKREKRSMKVTIEDIKTNPEKYKLCRNCWSYNLITNNRCHSCKHTNFSKDPEKVLKAIDNEIKMTTLNDGISRSEKLAQKVSVG